MPLQSIWGWSGFSKPGHRLLNVLWAEAGTHGPITPWCLLTCTESVLLFWNKANEKEHKSLKLMVEESSFFSFFFLTTFLQSCSFLYLKGEENPQTLGSLQVLICNKKRGSTQP